MKILCLIESLGAGGAERQLCTLASLLKKEGHELTVCSFMKGDFYLPLLEREGIGHIFIEPSFHRWLDDLKVVREIRRQKPDVLIAYLKKACMLACIAKKAGGSFRLIVSERNTSTSLGKEEKRRFPLFGCADAIVPNSYSQADFIRRYYPELVRKIKVIPNTVDLAHFSPADGKEKMGEIPEIIVPASVKPSKNTMLFLDALSLLSKRGHAFHVSWFGRDGGDSAYAERCAARIEELGLSGYISLKDKVEDIAGRYRESDFFCLPSLFEGTPNALCEALASGLPALCSNVCDNPRYVRPGENGFLFDPLSAEDMARKLSSALSMPADAYRKACLLSRSIAEKSFGAQSFIVSYLSLLE